MSIEDEAPIGAMFYSRTNTSIFFFKEENGSMFRWNDKCNSWENCTGLVSYRFLFDIKTKFRLQDVKKQPYVRPVKTKLRDDFENHKTFKYESKSGIIKLFRFIDGSDQPYIKAQDDWIKSSISKKLVSKIKRDCNLLTP